MNIRKNILSLCGIIFQVASLVLCFFPVVFKIVVFECDPYVNCTSFEDGFTKTGETFAYNIFFNPEKFFVYKNMSISVDAFPKAFAVLFIVFCVITTALGVLSLLKKKISYSAAISAFVTLILFFIQAYKVCFFSQIYLTWKYCGDFGFGCRLILIFEIVAAVLFLLNGKLKFKGNKKQKTEEKTAEE